MNYTTFPVYGEAKLEEPTPLMLVRKIHYLQSKNGAEEREVCSEKGWEWEAITEAVMTRWHTFSDALELENLWFAMREVMPHSGCDAMRANSMIKRVGKGTVARQGSRFEPNCHGIGLHLRGPAL